MTDEQMMRAAVDAGRDDPLTLRVWADALEDAGDREAAYGVRCIAGWNQGRLACNCYTPLQLCDSQVTLYCWTRSHREDQTAHYVPASLGTHLENDESVERHLYASRSDAYLDLARAWCARDGR